MNRRRVIDIALTGVVLVAIVGLYRLTPTKADFQQPVQVNGTAGKVVQTPRFEITVEAVRVGKKLKVPRTRPDRETSTSWVVVDAIVTARQDPMHLGSVFIRNTDGVQYRATNRNAISRVDLTGFEFQPGIPVRGSFAIEMPADQLAGARLEVIENGVFTALEPQATIPLPAAEGEQPVVELKEATA
ncbi:hypothetical protein OG394_20875 [Kribbella sp. NBC_01245]|uniref:hypothetical protein n=1 Tax=Kribbella sp. NBC_01245 TaxID=2903578 RepID=UPI002E2CF707|nr:hypothetical protein [Kribbella sp. NBC_01245]